MHIEVIKVLVYMELPNLSRHFTDRNVEISIFTQNWIMTMFTQVIPLNQVHRFWTLFW